MFDRSNINNTRREFIKKSGIVASGVIGGNTLLTNFVKPVTASAADPHWTISDQSITQLPLAAPTPEGSHTRTTSFGSTLNYIASYWGEDTSNNIHAFTYGAKGICTHSPAGDTTEYSYDWLREQTLQVSSYKQEDNLDYADDPFEDAPGFGVRPSSGGSSPNYGEAAQIALETAISEALGYYNPAFSIGYGAAKAIAALQDTSGSPVSNAKTLDYESDHWNSSENETYARFLARHDATQEAGMKVHGRAQGPATTFYIRFPATTQTSSTYTSQGVNTSGEELQPESHMSDSAAELRQKGFRLLTDNHKVVHEGVVPNKAVEKRPSLKAVAGGGRLHRIKYPMWGKAVSECVGVEKPRGGIKRVLESVKVEKPHGRK